MGCVLIAINNFKIYKVKESIMILITIVEIKSSFVKIENSKKSLVIVGSIYNDNQTTN